MNTSKLNQNRKIQIDEHILDLKRPPSLQPSVHFRKIGDYPAIPKAYLETARHYTNPLLLGPPLCDELMALIQHMFTEEEADLVRYIKSVKGKTAREVAVAAHRPIEEVSLILERLAYDKFILLCSGVGEKKCYGLMPILPGVFEFVMMQSSLDALTDWHRRFAELYTALYDTGYIVDYFKYPSGGVHYIPIGETVNTSQTAWPSDRLEEVFDKYDVFAVGLCDCRVTEQIVGRGCGRPLENCIGFGELAETFIQHDKMRRIEKKDALEIKAKAAASGLASFVVEAKLGDVSGGASCSCCGCCCGALRTINQFNIPGMVAPPHFMPQVNLAQCVYCARCAKVCPVQALVVDAKKRSLQYRPERCIGCGLCAVACDRQQAIQMEPVAKNIQLSQGKLNTLKFAANHLRNAWSVWRKYRG